MTPRYTIPVMVLSMKKKGPYTLSLLRAQNTFTFHEYVPANMFRSPDPAVVNINLTTDMKHVPITDNFGVQKFLNVLYQMKHLHI
jgi:hypothetical protein